MATSLTTSRQSSVVAATTSATAVCSKQGPLYGCCWRPQPTEATAHAE
jgi:hypothetical protein